MIEKRLPKIIKGLYGLISYSWFSIIMFPGVIILLVIGWVFRSEVNSNALVEVCKAYEGSTLLEVVFPGVVGAIVCTFVIWRNWERINRSFFWTKAILIMFWINSLFLLLQSEIEFGCIRAIHGEVTGVIGSGLFVLVLGVVSNVVLVLALLFCRLGVIDEK